MLFQMTQKLRLYPPAFHRTTAKEVLRDIDFCRGMGDNEFNRFVELTEEKLFQRGSILVNQGRVSDELIIVTAGKGVGVTNRRRLLMYILLSIYRKGEDYAC